MFRNPSRWIVILVLAGVLAGSGLLAQPAAPAFKDTTALPSGPQGARIRSTLEVLNSGSVDRIKRFLAEECTKEFREMVPVDEHVATALGFLRDTGGADFYSVRT